MKFEAGLDSNGKRLMQWLGDAKAELVEEWRKQLHERGQEMRRWAVKRYRRGHQSKARTASRSGLLANAYGFRVYRGKSARDGVLQLHYGLTKPNTKAAVLRYGALQEGYRANGQQFTSLKITPKTPGGWLTYPKYAPGGGTKIVGWGRAKEVTFKPRPSFPGVKEKYDPIIARDLSASAAKAWSQAA